MSLLKDIIVKNTDDKPVQVGAKEDVPTVDVRSLDLFEQMLITLKKIEYHLAMATDTNLED